MNDPVMVLKSQNRAPFLAVNHVNHIGVLTLAAKKPKTVNQLKTGKNHYRLRFNSQSFQGS